MSLSSERTCFCLGVTCFYLENKMFRFESDFVLLGIICFRSDMTCFTFPFGNKYSPSEVDMVPFGDDMSSVEMTCSVF